MSFILIGLLIITFVLMLFGLAMTFFDNYIFVAQVILLISILGMVGIVMCIMMLQPVLPFLDAKLKNGMILMINQVNDNIVMVVPSKKATTLDTGDRFGTFIGSPNAVKAFIGFRKEEDLIAEYDDREIVEEDKQRYGNRLIDKLDIDTKTRSFGGVKTYLVYEENAVPPETDLVKLCQRLEETNIKDIGSLRKKLGNKKSPIIFKDLDLKSITRYFDYVNPHYLNVRVERTAARLSKKYTQSWQKLLPWISMMTMALLFGAVAYAIIMSAVSGPAVAPPVATTILT